MRQACGLVPIVEPEVLIDGSHGMARSGAVSERVLQACVAALWQRPVTLEAVLLKPMMVLPGADHAGPPAAPAEVAQATLTAMRRCFLSQQTGLIVNHTWLRGANACIVLQATCDVKQGSIRRQTK